MVTSISQGTFFSKDVYASSTESPVQHPVAIHLSTYGAGRLSTMAEVNLRPPIAPDRDSLVPYPSPRALTVPPTSGRAQILARYSPFMAQGSEILSTSVDDTTQQAPSQGCSPEVPPATPIPPKPPYCYNGPLTTARGPCKARPFPINAPQSPSTIVRTTITTADEYRRAENPPEASAVFDTGQQWEHSRAFHSSVSLWPQDVSMQEMKGGSPLIRSMFHPPSDARLPTYSWLRHWDFPPEIDSPSHPETGSSSFLSQSRWQDRTDPSRASNTSTRLLRYVRRLSTSPKPQPMSSQKIIDDSQQDWEQMRAFHSSNPVWPAQERLGSTPVQGGSPLLWTTLIPSPVNQRLQTYAWNGHLENFLPWSEGQEGATERPAIISQAHWNSRSLTLSLTMGNSPQGSTNAYRGQSAAPQSAGSSPKYATSCTSEPLAEAPLSQQPTPAWHPDAIKETKLPDLIGRPPLDIRQSEESKTWLSDRTAAATNQVKSAPPPRNPLKSLRKHSVLMAIVIYLLLVHGSSHPEPMAPQPNLPVHWYGNYWRYRLASVIQTRKSCCRRTTVIIQRMWDTAWDLLAHRNVDSCSFGLASPHPYGQYLVSPARPLVLKSSFHTWPQPPLFLDRFLSLVS